MRQKETVQEPDGAGTTRARQANGDSDTRTETVSFAGGEHDLDVVRGGQRGDESLARAEKAKEGSGHEGCGGEVGEVGRDVE